MVGARIPKLTDVTVRLAEMDAQGVDRQWVSASPNHFYPWAPEGLAVWVANEANRLVAAHVAQAPERLTGLGLVLLQHPERIVECLDDAVLAVGSPAWRSRRSPATSSCRTRASSRSGRARRSCGAVVFLHPFGCCLDERLDRFYLANTVGQPVENAVALSHLIFAGVLDRHPELKHRRRARRRVPAHRDRSLRPCVAGASRCAPVRHAPVEYLTRIWFDTVVHDARALRQLVEVAGAGQVVLGSDFPFDMGLEDPAAFVRASGLGGEEIARILGENADGLLETLVRA